MTDRYWLSTPGSKEPPRGPLFVSVIEAEWRSGTLHSGARVCRIGEARWTPVSEMFPPGILSSPAIEAVPQRGGASRRSAVILGLALVGAIGGLASLTLTIWMGRSKEHVGTDVSATASASVPEASNPPSTSQARVLQGQDAVLTLHKMSGPGGAATNPTTHRVRVRVTGAGVLPQNNGVLVQYRFSVLDDSTVAFYCSTQAEYVIHGQGWWLVTPNGTRYQASKQQHTEAFGVGPHDARCVFNVPITSLEGVRFVYIPALDLPGWRKDETNRPVPAIEVALRDTEPLGSP